MDFVIQWHHKTRHGNKGMGTNRYSQHDAELLATELNREFPHIEHKAVPAADRPTPDHYPNHD